MRSNICGHIDEINELKKIIFRALLVLQTFLCLEMNNNNAGKAKSKANFCYHEVSVVYSIDLVLSFSEIF